MLPLTYTHIRLCTIHSLIIILCSVCFFFFVRSFVFFPLNLRRMCVIQIHEHKNVQVKSIYSQTCRKISGVISVENHFIEFCFPFLVDIFLHLFFCYLFFLLAHFNLERLRFYRTVTAECIKWKMH